MEHSTCQKMERIPSGGCDVGNVQVDSLACHDHGTGFQYNL